jgi:hypothetical protein
MFTGQNTFHSTENLNNKTGNVLYSTIILLKKLQVFIIVFTSYKKILNDER